MSTLTDRANIDELARQLANTEVESDVFRARKVLRIALRQVHSGVDTQVLFPQVIKYVASTDVLTKKLACWFIQKHGENSELLLLGVNSLVKDCQDPSPMTRGLALRTLTSLPHKNLLDYMVQPTLRGLTDPSAYVRRVSVVACVKLYHMDQDFVTDHGVIDQLYAMIRDSDPIVVSSCLSALEELLAPEGGVVINRNIAHYLHNKLGMFTEWGLVTVLQLLKKYQPQTEDEALDVMNIIDTYLKYNNASVVISTIDYFVHLVKEMPHLKSEIYNRAKSQMLHFLGCGNPELVYVLLDSIADILPENKEVFQAHHRAFFCKYNEPVHLKTKKLQMLPSVVCTASFQDVLEELGMYSMDVIPEVTAASITSVAKLAEMFPNHFLTCIRKLINLLQLDMPHVTNSVLAVVQTLDLNKHGCAQDVMSQVLNHAAMVTSTEGKCAILCLLGEYSDTVENSPYVLEEYIDSISKETELPFSLCLLTTAVKLTLKKPAQCQDMLATVFEHCLSSENLDLRERAMFYYTLLKTDVYEARRIVCGV